MPRKIDMIGKRFGRLTVIEESSKRVGKSITYICRCDCGNVTKPIQGANLRNGNTKSCGCLHEETMREILQKHGEKQTRLYRIWQNMKNRCRNKNVSCYKYYGGKGVGVCDKWANDFLSFRNWALENGYEENLTIDRIDNDGDYEPSNCRWVTMGVQSRNKRHGANPYRDKKTGRYASKEGVDNGKGEQ